MPPCTTFCRECRNDDSNLHYCRRLSENRRIAEKKLATPIAWQVWRCAPAARVTQSRRNTGPRRNSSWPTARLARMCDGRNREPRRHRGQTPPDALKPADCRPRRNSETWAAAGWTKTQNCILPEAEYPMQKIFQNRDLHIREHPNRNNRKPSTEHRLSATAAQTAARSAESDAI